MTTRKQKHFLGLLFIVSGALGSTILSPSIAKEGTPITTTCTPSKVGLNGMKDQIVQVTLMRNGEGKPSYIASIVPLESEARNLIIHLARSEIVHWTIFSPGSLGSVVLQAVKQEVEQSDAGNYTCVVYFRQGRQNIDNLKESNSLIVIPRSPRPIVLHSIVVKGSTFMAHCDVSRVNIAHREYSLNQLQMYHAQKCGHSYSLIGQLDLAKNRSTENKTLPELPKNWVLEKNENAENLPKLHGPELLLRVHGGSQRDGGCFQCKVVYTISGGRPEAVISEVTVTIKEIEDDSASHVRFEPFHAPEKGDFVAVRQLSRNDASSVFLGAASRLALVCVTSLVLINYQIK
ncbi:uncharacterized protein LOC131954545 [Physella acuta]|uniref:uncharacterized protein LOC131954545 n=1 Tax=Physella acuta TaxID=109671 RepID=UPI0027DC8724|nr:uncharacterized protein LOC131954545 [Physella acuta]XP_059174294.1 uncharacterized protein LOC131954545 [Physella acuta]